MSIRGSRLQLHVSNGELWTKTHCNLRGIVDVGATTEQEMVDRLEVSQLLASLENMVLGGAEAESLLSLGLRARKDNHMASHGSCQLDRQVAETTDAHDTHAISRTNTVFRQDGPHGSTSTHQRRSIGRVISIGDGDHAAGIPDDTLAERPQVVIVATIFPLVLTVLVPPYWNQISLTLGALGIWRVNIPVKHCSQVPHT